MAWNLASSAADILYSAFYGLLDSVVDIWTWKDYYFLSMACCRSWIVQKSRLVKPKKFATSCICYMHLYHFWKNSIKSKWWRKDLKPRYKVLVSCRMNCAIFFLATAWSYLEIAMLTKDELNVWHLTKDRFGSCLVCLTFMSVYLSVCFLGKTPSLRMSPHRHRPGKAKTHENNDYLVQVWPQEG